MVSEKTVAAREQVETILVRHSVGRLSLARTIHEVWKVINTLQFSYDEGYTAGYRASEEASASPPPRRKRSRS